MSDAKLVETGVNAAIQIFSYFQTAKLLQGKSAEEAEAILKKLQIFRIDLQEEIQIGNERIRENK